MRLSPDRGVRALAGDTVLCSWTLYSHSASLHPDVQIGTGELKDIRAKFSNIDFFLRLLPL